MYVHTQTHTSEQHTQKDDAPKKIDLLDLTTLRKKKYATDTTSTKA